MGPGGSLNSQDFFPVLVNVLAKMFHITLIWFMFCLLMRNNNCGNILWCLSNGRKDVLQ